MSFRILKFWSVQFPLKNFIVKTYLENKKSHKFRYTLDKKYSVQNYLAIESSRSKFNYHEDCERCINKQITLELFASYSYLSMAYHFQQHTIALPGFYNMFLFYSKEETEHAMNFMDYQNKRGGDLCYEDIKVPEVQEWTPCTAVCKAIELEESVTNCLIQLHSIAGKRKDANLCDFIETNYLQEQYDALKELRDLHTRILSVGAGLGEHILDQELIKRFKKKNDKLKIIKE